jgi:hypothetical protein
MENSMQGEHLCDNQSDVGVGVDWMDPFDWSGTVLPSCSEHKITEGFESHIEKSELSYK